MLTKKEYEYLVDLLYHSQNPLALKVWDKIDKMVIEYGLVDN